jgi:hypothetical protein
MATFSSMSATTQRRSYGAALYPEMDTCRLQQKVERRVDDAPNGKLPALFACSDGGGPIQVTFRRAEYTVQFHLVAGRQRRADALAPGLG